MANSGEWADHIIVMATGIYLKRTIVVVTSSPKSGSHNSLIYVNSTEMLNRSPMHIGHIWENHYLSLCAKDESEKCVIGNCNFNKYRAAR